MFQAFLICLIQEKGKKKKPEVRLKFADEVEEGEIISEVSQLDSDTKHPTTNLDKTDKAAAKTTVAHPAVIQKTGSNRNGGLKTNVNDSAVAENASDLAVIPKNGSNQKGSSENSKEKQMDPTTATAIAVLKRQF